MKSKYVCESLNEFLLETKKMKGKDPCWDGYKMVGKKEKDGKEVPNCVPEDDVDESLSSSETIRNIYEFQRAEEDPDRIKEIMKIGNAKARAGNILKKFADDNGYAFKENKNGNFEILGHKRFSITFPTERADTDKPISLRNSSGQLMDRFSNAQEVIDRIKGNIAREEKAQKKVETPEELLLRSIGSQDTVSVKALLARGVSPNHKVRSKIHENIPLIVAVNSGNFPIVKALVEAGADVNAKTRDGSWTPLGAAIGGGNGLWPKESGGFFKIVKYLVEAGANPFSEPNFYWRLNSSSSAIIKYLLEVFPDSFDQQELVDMLGSAAWMGKAPLVKILLDFGVDPYAKSSAGRRNDAFKSLAEAKVSLATRNEPHGEYYRYDETEEILNAYK
jgi:hypothetical protein